MRIEPTRMARRRSVAAAAGDSAGAGRKPASPRYSAAGHVLNEAEHHADAGRGEAEVPVDVLSEIAADERREERAEVDAHVEDREPGIAPLVLGRIELADDDADVAFQQPRADDDQEQAEIEGRERRARPC